MKEKLRIRERFFGSRLMVIAWTLLVTGLIGLGLNYLFLVPATLESFEMWFFITLLLLIATGVSWLFSFIRERIKDEYFSDTIKDYIVTVILLAVWILSLLIWLITGMTGWKMFNAESYSNLISIESCSFEQDIQEVDVNNMITTDVKTARKLGDRTLGSVKDSSWYEVDTEYNLISIAGEYYRISPLNYGGLFKYLSAKSTGIPGYVLVNAKTQEAQYVELDNAMNYSPSAHFEKNLTRHMRGQYPRYMFGKSFFEVDDEGNPYWITGVKAKQIGVMGAPIVTSAIITDAITGESKEYSLSKLPEWVDHVYSIDDLMEVVDWHYSLANGYFNFSDTGVFKTSYSYRDKESKKDESEYTPFEGYNSVISRNGQIWFYTGITPANNAETIIGFILANPKTGEVRFYSVEGAEESSAQSSAEGLVQNLKYSASFPTIINVNGIETYFMTLKDSGGLIKKYAFCNVKDYTKVVEADSIKSALDEYQLLMGIKSLDNIGVVDESITSEGRKVKTVEGVITEVKEAEKDGYTHYFFTLEDEDDIIFMSSIENSNLQPMKLVIGNSISIKYRDSEEQGLEIVTSISFNS